MKQLSLILLLVAGCNAHQIRSIETSTGYGQIDATDGARDMYDARIGFHPFAGYKAEPPRREPPPPPPPVPWYEDKEGTIAVVTAILVALGLGVNHVRKKKK